MERVGSTCAVAVPLLLRLHTHGIVPSSPSDRFEQIISDALDSVSLG